MKLLLGGSLERKKGYTYTVQRPGTDHHTRWISKAIYILKMVLLQHQLPELHWQTKKVTTISFFVVLSTWSTGSLLPPSSLLASLLAPDMDPYPHVHKVLTLSRAAAVLLGHSWYLTKDLIIALGGDTRPHQDDHRKKYTLKTKKDLKKLY